jgi:hypothetical protein
MITKIVCAFVVVASVLLTTTPGRSQDAGRAPRPIIPAAAAGSFETTQPAPVAKSLTVPQRMEGDVRLRPVSHMAAAPEQSAVPSAAPETVPIPPDSRAIYPMPLVGEPCLSGPRPRSCWEQLDDWVTYRPLHKDCCDCLPRCAPCCPPPLYTFFIGGCCVHPTGPVCSTPPCGSGHRLVSLWNGVRNCRYWPGNLGFQFWHGSSDFLFWHGKSCAQGDCGAEQRVVENAN